MPRDEGKMAGLFQMMNGALDNNTPEEKDFIQKLRRQENEMMDTWTKYSDGIPPFFTSFPWKIPVDSGEELGLRVETIEKVNKILNYSAKLQNSVGQNHIEKDEDGRRILDPINPEDGDIPMGSLGFSGVLRIYVNAILGEDEQKPRLTLGQLDGKTRAWLEFGEREEDKVNPIDNYILDMNKDNMKTRVKDNYKIVTPYNLKGKIEGTPAKIYEHYTKNDQVEKYIVFALGDLNTSELFLIYMRAMNYFVKKEFGVKASLLDDDLKEYWKTTCWSCRKRPQNPEGTLKTCTECMVSKYCSRECQKKEWKLHKVLCQNIDTQQVKTKHILNEFAKMMESRRK